MLDFPQMICVMHRHKHNLSKYDKSNIIKATQGLAVQPLFDLVCLFDLQFMVVAFLKACTLLLISNSHQDLLTI